LRRLAALAIAVIATLALRAGPGEAWTKRSTKVTVMTRNLYLGTDLIPIATQRPRPPSSRRRPGASTT
jgi:hypothetical protein